MKSLALLFLLAVLPLLAADHPKARPAKPAPAGKAERPGVAVGSYLSSDAAANKAVSTALYGAKINFNLTISRGATIDVSEDDAPAARAILEKLVADQHLAINVIQAEPAKAKK